MLSIVVECYETSLGRIILIYYTRTDAAFAVGQHNYTSKNDGQSDHASSFVEKNRPEHRVQGGTRNIAGSWSGHGERNHRRASIQKRQRSQKRERNR